EQNGAASAVAEVYRILDEAAGGLLEVAAGGDVLVVSDNGGGSLKRVVNLNGWLAEQGFLTYRTGRLPRSTGEAAHAALHTLLEQRRRLPKGLRRYLKRYYPGFREREQQLRQYTVIDWPQTRAFAYGI